MAEKSEKSKRPSDVVGNAVRVMEIATGQAENDAKDDKATAAARRGGKKGGRARASKLSPEERSRIARLAAQARWKKSG